jgi:hypothetical protein
MVKGRLVSGFTSKKLLRIIQHVSFPGEWKYYDSTAFIQMDLDPSGSSMADDPVSAYR